MILELEDEGRAARPVSRKLRTTEQGYPLYPSSAVKHEAVRAEGLRQEGNEPHNRCDIWNDGQPQNIFTITRANQNRPV